MWEYVSNKSDIVCVSVWIDELDVKQQSVLHTEQFDEELNTEKEENIGVYTGVCVQIRVFQRECAYVCVCVFVYMCCAVLHHSFRLQILLI